jgi:hypothetical protein
VIPAGAPGMPTMSYDGYADVLVVGAGPVGLVLAGEPARRGTSVRLVDKLAAPTDESRAIIVHPRSLEMTERVGTVDALIASGVRTTAAEFHADDKRLGRVELDTVDSPYPFSVATAQTEIERALLWLPSAQAMNAERKRSSPPAWPGLRGGRCGAHAQPRRRPGHEHGHAGRVNLGWKLAAAAAGQGAEEWSLSGYFSPHGRRALGWIRAARRSSNSRARSTASRRPTPTGSPTARFAGAFFSQPRGSPAPRHISRRVGAADELCASALTDDV